MKRWSLVRKKIQQNLEEIIKKGNMLPIIITSNYSYQVFGKGLSCMQLSWTPVKLSWTPVIGEYLIKNMQPTSPVNKHTYQKVKSFQKQFFIFC